MIDKKILLNVEGMDCSHCAQTITRALNKSGLKEVNVNFATGEVSFEVVPHEEIDHAIREIRKLGYGVNGMQQPGTDVHSAGHVHDHTDTGKLTLAKKFYISLFFTVPLLLNMVLNISFLHHPVVQLVLCLPVMWIGTFHFGKSALKSILVGFPNMDVLIMLGSSAAFIYSVAGMILYSGSTNVSQFLFFETAATIITLVLLGNLIEQRSVKRTTTALQELSKLQPDRAKKVMAINGSEQFIETDIKNIVKGDILIVNTGDKIPVDGTVLKGTAMVDESLITGESLPVSKNEGSDVTGSTTLQSGMIRMVAEKVGDETTLAQIIRLVKNAQNTRPKIQKLGDRISAVFVPVVAGISVLTFLIEYLFMNFPLQNSLMNCIAILVISCPCAMGLAAPTAVMVGIGRAARNGILIKGGDTMEEFSSIRTIVFDKTGTLTTGNFLIHKIKIHEGNEPEIKNILYSLEQHSSHPIARSITRELHSNRDQSIIEWQNIEEDKGIGINGTDKDGNLYSAGSFQMVKHFYHDLSHSVYLLKNNRLIATVDLADDIKPGIGETIAQLKKLGLRVIMVSGDRKVACDLVAAKVGIDEVYSEQHPAQKLEIIEQLSKSSPTAMVGDGINDAPALAKATIGVSLSDATQVAIQSSRIILLQQKNLQSLIVALTISKQTYLTIKQNFFWAFFYNIVAIPVAAAGFLSPMIGAFSMAFSDVVVIGNSLRLHTRKIQ